MNNSTQYQYTKIFTSDWFSHNIPVWDNYKSLFFNKPNMHCLEIGSFEGRSTIYTVENYCNGNGSYVDALDTWEGSFEHSKFLKMNLYERFLNNVKQYTNEGKIRVHKGYSSKTLMTFIQNEKKYDFIYVDASHVARDVLMDAVLSWELLKIGGVMAFDDYQWSDYSSGKEISSMSPKPAIDGFLSSNFNTYDLLHKDYQIHILKRSDHPAADILLYNAVLDKDGSSIKYALDKGANINYIYPIGATALHLAVERDFLEGVKTLLENGANPNLQTNTGMSSLYRSVLENNYNITKLLLENGAETEISFSSGVTPLFAASFFGLDEVLKLLIDYGANTNTNVQGTSSFYVALQEDHPSTATIIAGSTEMFCQQILGTAYEEKYIELCGETTE